MPLQSANFRLTASAQFQTNYGTLPPTLAQLQSTFNVGIGANLADILYVANRSAGTSGDSIDLTGGGLLQPDGTTAFNAARIVAIGIINRGTAALTVGGGTNAIADVTMYIGAGGFGALQAPDATAYPVTAGTADILKVTAASGTVSYDIFLLGRSA